MVIHNEAKEFSPPTVPVPVRRESREGGLLAYAILFPLLGLGGFGNQRSILPFFFK